MMLAHAAHAADASALFAEGERAFAVGDRVQFTFETDQPTVMTERHNDVQ